MAKLLLRNEQYSRITRQIGRSNAHTLPLGIADGVAIEIKRGRAPIGSLIMKQTKQNKINRVGYLQ